MTDFIRDFVFRGIVVLAVILVLMGLLDQGICLARLVFGEWTPDVLWGVSPTVLAMTVGFIGAARAAWNNKEC